MNKMEKETEKSIDNMVNGNVAIVNSKKDSTILFEANKLFNDNNGSLPIRDFNSALTERFNFSPLNIIRDDVDRELKKQILHSDLYVVVEGHIYQN